MKRMHMAAILLLLALAAGPVAASNEHSRLAVPERPTVMPDGLLFIENVGQFDPAARFQAWGDGQTLWLAENTVWLTIVERLQVDTSEHRVPERESMQDESVPRQAVNIKLSFPGANPHPMLEPFDRLDTHVAYFLGNDPAEWRNEVPVWGGMRYRDLYPGIDLELAATNGGWQWRFVMAAHPATAMTDGDAKLRADWRERVTLRVEGAEVVAAKAAALHLKTAAGEAELPLLLDGGASSSASVRPRGDQAFDVSAPFASVHINMQSEIANLQSQDLLYGTFLGGSDDDWGDAIAVDEAGNAYVTGASKSSDFPTMPGAFDPSLNGSYDTFVVKLNPAGSGLAYATFVGGSESDLGYDIALDGTGSAYVTGQTSSSDFPTTPGAFDAGYNGGDLDAFVVKLNPAGNALAYATFLGGGNNEISYTIDVDGTGNAYVTGETSSSDFPTTPVAFDPSYNGNSDAFVVKLNAAGSGLDYSTFLGGERYDGGSDIAVDGAGSAYVTGGTGSSNFPTTPGAFDTSLSLNNGDAFVVKFNSSGNALVYGTFLGGNGGEAGSAIDVDVTGSAYVTGSTYSSDFPTTPGAFDTSYNGGNWDAFVVKLNTAGSGLDYATFLGGVDEDTSSTIVIDGMGDAYVTGATVSSDFPTTPIAFDTSHNGGAGYDAFVVKLDTTGSRLAYATFLGGTGGDRGLGIAVGGAGNVYATGDTSSSDFPTTPGTFDTSYNGNDGFVVKLKPSPWAVWQHDGSRVSLPPYGAEVVIDYGNWPPPVIFSASLTGAAVFEDDSTAISETWSSGTGSRALRLKPAPAASPGDAFAVSANVGSLALTTEGQIVATTYLPLLLRQ